MSRPVKIVVAMILITGSSSGILDAYEYYRSNTGYGNSANSHYRSSSGIVEQRFTRPTCNLYFNTKRDHEEYNRWIVLKFYERYFGDLDFQGAADTYISPTEYIQHNPTVADGIPAFVAFGKITFEGDQPKIIDIRGTAADGNLVWLHVRNRIQGVDYAIVEIYRLNCGKIVEHWDVVQAIGNGPFANSHPFF